MHVGNVLAAIWRWLVFNASFWLIADTGSVLYALEDRDFAELMKYEISASARVYVVGLTTAARTQVYNTC